MQKIAIIIPCFDEAKRLDVSRIHSFLEQNPNVNVCFVNDGSGDSTSQVIDAAASARPNQIETLHLQHHSGKAEAIRQGMLKQVSNEDLQWLGYWDADLATPLEEIDHLLKYAKEPVKLLMCSRFKRLGATINRHLHRHILGRVMATIISNVLKLPVYDTQCGAKLIRREEVESIFSEEFLARWMFDVEIIARMQKKYPANTILQDILEVPVYRWDDVPGSKLKFKHMFSSLIDIAKIYWKYNIKTK
jgi:glycosyltransferase involved in cell wall biosynthesis